MKKEGKGLKSQGEIVRVLCYSIFRTRLFGGNSKGNELPYIWHTIILVVNYYNNS